MPNLDELPQIILKPRKAQPFFAGHPWVFTGAIATEPAGLKEGAEVLLVTDQRQPIARGLYNPLSNIRVRLYSWDLNVAIDEEFFEQRIRSAVRLRQRLFPHDRDWKMSRLVFSEADGLSGLTVDGFGDWICVQFTSLALAMRQEMICNILDRVLQPFGIMLRTEKGMTAAEGIMLKDGPLRGDPPPSPLYIHENDLDYQIDLREGQKTGFYYDQRDNRKVAARYLFGEVLDLCSYSGGFALNALKYGLAEKVTCVDSSASALELAAKNAELNELADRIDFQVSEGLRYLEQTDRQFDSIILDPPKFARSRGGVDRALKAYYKWNAAALRKLKSPGILVTCSCSGLVSEEEFLNSIQLAGSQAGRFIRLLEARGQSPDHPVSLQCPENAYLKCLICAVE
ncbi:MAG: class I SAM-dependent rRNA methyltransferase [Planctomycetaceae bacterium]|nr:class I SAM-dependent rRNA methyltransferase [Planctomycetaceae bacterium]